MDKTALIYKVLSGNATLEERDELNAWIELDTANSEEFEDTRLLWDYVKSVRHDQILEQSYDGLRRIKQMFRSASHG